MPAGRFGAVDVLEGIVLSVGRTARCRLLGSDNSFVVRAERFRDLVPGEIIVISGAERSTRAGEDCVAGVIESTRLDVHALQLRPLRIEAGGRWNPSEQFWGDDGEPTDKWAKAIIARGPRPQFEMEQVLPGVGDDSFTDRIVDAVDIAAAGSPSRTRRMLMRLCEGDLRCFDAHAHLGFLAYNRRLEQAIRHYEVGFRIGELSLGPGFDGLLSWGWMDNRPFLRCMHGFGLCLWRLGRLDEAANLFQRMLWLNPSDNQGAGS